MLAKSFSINTETIFIEGDAGKEIVLAALRHNTDLLILGTHGYTGWNHLTLGSIAEYVIRHAACPVLTIKPGETNRPEIYSSTALARDN